MKRRVGTALLLAIATVLVGLVAAQISYGLLPIGTDGPREVTLQDVSDDTDRYLGERIVADGWYQGGLIRDANPLCANTREGVQKEPYAYVFADIRANVTLVTGVEYRFVGTLRPSSEVDLPTVQSRPVFVVRKVERIGRNPDECSFVSTPDED